MDKLVKILLFDSDETSKVLIENYIKELTFDCSFSKYDDFEEGLIPNDDSKKVIIVNLSKNNNEILEKIKHLSHNQNNYFIAISFDKTADLHVKSVRAGAKELLYKPVIKADFIYALQKFYKKEILKMTDKKNCNLSIFLSVESGSGKTFTALNIAKEIADVSNKKTLLVDFNNNLNDITSSLNLHFDYSTSYIIDNCTNENFELFNKIHNYKKSNLYIMGNGVFRYNFVYNEETLNNFIEKMKKEFSYIIFDTDISKIEMNKFITSKSNNIFYIVEPEISMFDTLITKHSFILEDKRTKILLNKYSKNKHEKLLPRLTQTVKKNIYAKIPKNHIATNASMANHKTLKEVTPTLDIVKIYNLIANEIIKKA